MRRGFAVIVCVCIFLLTSCRSLEREGLMSLPENAPPLTYDEMLTRARGQSASALDAFYTDAWFDLEQAAGRLEQSARLLPKSLLIPVKIKAKIADEADQLRQDAVKLIDAARTKNSAQANEAMQRINLRIRELRLAESD